MADETKTFEIEFVEEKGDEEEAIKYSIGLNCDRIVKLIQEHEPAMWQHICFLWTQHRQPDFDNWFFNYEENHRLQALDL